MVDGSMSTIHFHTIPKVYLPHYSYIFGNPEPLGKDINCVDCYRLVYICVDNKDTR